MSLRKNIRRVARCEQIFETKVGAISCAVAAWWHSDVAFLAIPSFPLPTRAAGSAGPPSRPSLRHEFPSRSPGRERTLQTDLRHHENQARRESPTPKTQPLA